MAIVTEFTMSEGGKADIKLIPVNEFGTKAEIENVDFSSSDPDITLTVDINDPMLFHAESVPDIAEDKDIELKLHCDGKVGEGENVIDKVLICHLKNSVAADVQFDVSVLQ